MCILLVHECGEGDVHAGHVHIECVCVCVYMCFCVPACVCTCTCTCICCVCVFKVPLGEHYMEIAVYLLNDIQHNTGFP